MVVTVYGGRMCQSVINLLNVDAIQGLDLLSSGGGFGFVVSISLKVK